MKFPRATHRNIYLKTETAGARVMESVKQYLEKKLKLKVNPKKSKVEQASWVKFLGYSSFKRKGEVLIRHSEPDEGTLYGENTEPDQANALRQAGRHRERDKPLYYSLDGLLSISGYTERN
jgi:hypothetical protein